MLDISVLILYLYNGIVIDRVFITPHDSLAITIIPAVRDQHETGNTITLIIIVTALALVLVSIVTTGICGVLLCKHYNFCSNFAQNKEQAMACQAQDTAQDHSPPPAPPASSSPPPAFTAFSPLPPEFFDILPGSGNCIGTKGGYTSLEQYGLHLLIPPGAIPAGIDISIDIGVALYGPFQYPERLRPVSPVFWICVYTWSGEFQIPFITVLALTLENTSHWDSLS